MTTRYKIFLGKEYYKTIRSKFIENYIDRKFGKEWNYQIDETKKVVILTIKNNFMMSS